LLQNPSQTEIIGIMYDMKLAELSVTKIGNIEQKTLMSLKQTEQKYERLM